MKNKVEPQWQPIMDIQAVAVAYHHYGISVANNIRKTPELYDEERDRWTFQEIKHTPLTNHTSRPMKPDKARPVEVAEGQPVHRGFWFRLFGQKA